MSYIDIHNLTFSYEDGGEELFHEVNLHIDASWKLGLIGRNGRGKTTFLNLLMGKHAYSGSIRSDLSFAYFPFQPDDPEDLTLSVMQKAGPGAEDWELIREAQLLDVDAEHLYRPFGTLSGGEQIKVLLAALFAGEERFLLLDEPTNHVDESGRQKIGEYLKGKRGFILVSHDRALLDSCTDHILSINRADISLEQGNFSSWWENFRRKEQNERAENEKLKKEEARLSQAARQSAAWSDKVERSKFADSNSGSKLDRGYVGHKAAKMMQRAKNYEKRMQSAAEEKAKLLKNVETAEDLEIRPLPFSKKQLVSAKNLALYYGETCVCSGISFEVNAGDCVALSGRNGSGKSTLLKLLCGEPVRYTGTFSVAAGLVISAVPQDVSFLSGPVQDFAEKKQLRPQLLLTMLKKLGFSRDQFETRMEEMSEGQRKKILLATSLCRSAHLYVWDEPLNYIDVISRAQIEDLILRYRPTLLFVEHDRVFREKIATKEVEL